MKEPPYITYPRGHQWKTDEDGDIDIFAYSPEELKYCNGPLCVRCGYGFCHHCNKLPGMRCTADHSDEAP